jgi:hypothetical protein
LARFAALIAGIAALGLPALGCGGGGKRTDSERPVAPVAGERSVVWRPLARQPSEADTLFLLDASREQSLHPGAQGGFLSGPPDFDSYPWGSAVLAVSGRYREGVTTIGAPHPSLIYMPAEGLLAPDQFTIELWLKSSVPWHQLPQEVPLSVVDGGGSASLTLTVHSGTVAASLSQAERATPTSVSASSDQLASEPAGAWVELALTLKNHVLTLYVNGRPAASAGGAVGPVQWSDRAYEDGLVLLGGDGRPTTDLTLSDLRMSRWARTPGQRVSLAPPTVSVFVNRPRGQTIHQTLRGILHVIGTGADPRLVGRQITVVRTDKLLTATPIKAGAPDAAYPSAGVSGRYSYDWRVVDRTLRYIESFHAVPYLSIDAAPSLLGGTVPPFSGTKLLDSAVLAKNSGFPPQPPDNLSDYAAMVTDLVHHVEIEDHVHVVAWGVWNEPNVPNFWSGTLSQYLDLYAAVSKAVKAGDPQAPVGGPEITPDPDWFQAFMQAVAAEHLPLDFVSFHYYSGAVGTLDATHALVDQLAHKYGLPSPPLIVGEWNWDLENRPGSGHKPWSAANYFANDWAAAFDATSMIAMQRDQVTDAILTNDVTQIPSQSSLATPTIARAPLNVYRMWAMLGTNVIANTGPLPAGTSIIATRDSHGGVEVLIAHLRYRRDRSEPLTLRFVGAPHNATVTRYEIDDQHSDSIDTNPAHAALAQLPSTHLNNGTLALTLPARSVTLLRIGQ